MSGRLVASRTARREIVNIGTSEHTATNLRLFSLENQVALACVFGRVERCEAGERTWIGCGSGQENREIQGIGV